MMRLTAALKNSASSGAHSPTIRTIVGTGLRNEFAPHWPLPIPKPLPGQANKHTLVLDIDETLLHTFGMSSCEAPSEKVRLVNYHIALRPHVAEFLKEVSTLFEVVFWTAGTASYCSAVLDAIEHGLLGLPVSFYNWKEMVKESGKAGSGTGHANFYALSRTQTLESQSYMKYLPLLGRPMKSVIMLDDNVRSFPLNPRNGIRISPFDVDDRVMQNYTHVQQLLRDPATSAEDVQNIKSYMAKVEEELASSIQDRALLDVLPLLRVLAAVPYGEDITRELDHWRELDYVRCDDFKETMNRRSVVRQTILGNVLPERREDAIAPLKQNVMNSTFVESAKAEAQWMMSHGDVRSKL